MRINKIFAGTLICVIAISALLVFMNSSLRAQDADEYGPEISKKLDEVLKNQKDIMDGIAALKREVEIVKIRVTSR